MKILFITSNLSGGAGIASLRQAQALRSIGHDVDLITLDNRGDLKYLQFQVLKLKAKLNRKFEYIIIKRSGFGISQYKSVCWLPFDPLSVLNVYKYDVVHLHWINQGFIGLNKINKYVKKKRLFWSLHSCWPFSGPHHHPRVNSEPKKLNFYWKTDRNLIEKVKKQDIYWFTPSQFMVTELFQEQQVSIVPICLPLSFPEAIREVISEDVAFVCNGDVFDPRKGLLTLLNAWVQIWQEGQSRKLHVIGPVFDHSANQALLKLSKIRGVYYHGGLTPSEVPNFIRHIKAVLVPSNEETFGQVILESLALGTPVIANSRIRSLSEFEVGKKIIKAINFSKEELHSAFSWLDSLNYDKQEIATEVRVKFSSEKVAYLLQAAYLKRVPKQIN